MTSAGHPDLAAVAHVLSAGACGDHASPALLSVSSAAVVELADHGLEVGGLQGLLLEDAEDGVRAAVQEFLDELDAEMEFTMQHVPGDVDEDASDAEAAESSSGEEADTGEWDGSSASAASSEEEEAGEGSVVEGGGRDAPDSDSEPDVIDVTADAASELEEEAESSASSSEDWVPSPLVHGAVARPRLMRTAAAVAMARVEREPQSAQKARARKTPSSASSENGGGEGDETENEEESFAEIKSLRDRRVVQVDGVGQIQYQVRWKVAASDGSTRE